MLGSNAARRPWRAALVLALTLMMLGACSLVAGSRLQLLLEARAMAGGGYAFVPSEIVAPAGADVTLTLLNTSDAPHTLVLLEPIDRRTGAIVEPGQRDPLDFTTPGPGSYRFVCNVHQDMGGTLTIGR